MIQGKVLAFLALQIALVTCQNPGQMTTSGGHCVFPFIYKGVTYKTCTTKNHHRPWCSTTSNYDHDMEWGNCAGYTSSGVSTTSGGYCVFPFTYKNVVYKSCTTKGHTRPWCSTSTDYTIDSKWGNCADYTSSGFKTTSGEYCVFPFTYGGVDYHSCTSRNRNRPWCSTTASYQKDKKWGYCAGFSSSGVKTVSGQYCAFPFVYRGHLYNTCISSYHHRLWCSTTTNYDKDKKWENCA